MSSNLPKTEQEIQETLKHCGFCDMWHQYHQTCSITGDSKKWDSETCDMYNKSEETEKEYRAWIKERS